MVARTTVLSLMASLLLAQAPAWGQNELKDTLFKTADTARTAAEAANAERLAPRNFERGIKKYRDAETLLARDGNIETVRDNAADAASYFNAAARAAAVAATAFAQVMKSQQDAANAEAPKLAPETWAEAQRKFGDAIRLLERGDLKGAKRRDSEATALYREAELAAIKDRYLSETRRLLADADRARVGRYAPITLGNAKQLLARAEKELNENRYDTDLPRSLAREANYEAKHAIYLSEVVRRVRDRDLTAEELVLEWEQAFRLVASAADLSPDMATGPQALANALADYVDAQRIELQRLGQENEENALRLADMSEELRALDERLGGATSERAALVQRLEAQARIKEQFARVEQMFTADEARVFRQGNTVILRLVGLTFDSGASNIKPANVDLLNKIEKAVDVFPGSELVIEGHTDSFGGDDMNQKLSQDRAESVQQYMINAMRLPSYRLIATGYGETRPVASNETESGRAKNRRIDIVIRPTLEGV